MRNILWCLFFILIVAGHARAAGELAVQAEVVQATQRALAKSDYAALEALHKSLLAEDQRTPSGLWKLALYYNQLKAYARGEHDAVYWQYAHRMPLTWRKQFPNSVAARLFGVYLHLSQTLAVRGTGWGKDLTAAQLSQMRSSTAAAFKLLGDSRAQAQRVRDPEWYRAMLSVTPYSEGFSQAAMQRILAEGSARYPDYHELYFTAAFYAHERWHGAPDALERLTAAASVHGADLYARIYWYLDQAQYRGKLFELGPADWPAMRSSFEAMLARWPDPWNRNAFAWFACQAKDIPTMQQQLALLDGQLELEAWGGKSAHAACIAQRPDQPGYDRLRRAQMDRRYNAFIHYGQRLRAQKDYEASVAALHEAEAVDGKLGRTSMPVQFHLGWTFQEMGKHAEAVAALTHGLKAQPEYAEAYWRRGLSLKALGREQQAEKDFGDAARHLRRALEQPLPKLTPEQRALIESMRSTLREHGHETAPLP